MKVVTFNVGLLVYDLLKISLFAPVPHVKERLKNIPKALIESNADIICLQEIYHIEHKAFLYEKLKDHYQFIFYEHKGFRFSMENGLMVFSKLPLENFTNITFKATRFEEKVFASTGYQKFTINEYQFIHLHLTAGGILGPEHKSTERLRQSQIQQVLEQVNDMAVILGDFNCGPQISEDNYNLFLVNSFKNITSDQMTWDPENPLNKKGIHAHCPPQSIDHIMLNFDCKTTSSLIFDDPQIMTHKGAITLSDHYALEASISI